MKPVSEWIEADLHELVADQVQESLTLDYKRSEALTRTDRCRTDISKDVSAFANSAGGRIIYGIEETGHLPTGLDGGVDPAIISREWVEQTINSTIQPRISGIVIKPIPLAAGGMAYVVDIPQATAFAPHQAQDQRYYRRFNFQNVPMHDYEVRDALRRGAVSQPDVWFLWSTNPTNTQCGLGGRLTAVITNLGNEPILYAAINIFIERSFMGASLPSPEGFKIAERGAEIRPPVGAPIPLVSFNRNIMPPGHMPVFKGQNWHLFEIEVPTPPDPRGYHLGIDVRCPGAHVAGTGCYQFFGEAVYRTTSDCADLFRTVEPQMLQNT